MDDRFEHLFKYVYPIENSKTRDGIQHTGRCPHPDHPDKNNSFSYRTDDGRNYCHLGCFGGGAYDLCIKMGMDEKEARKYFVNNSNGAYTSPKPTKAKSTLTPSQLDALAKEYVKNLQHIKNPPKELVQRLDLMNRMGIKEFGLGVDSKKALTIPYINQNGIIEGIYHHNKVNRPYVEGDGTNRWYPMHKIFDYDRDKWMYGVEGELDAIVGNCNGIQTFTSTTGALSIPFKTEDGKQVVDLDIIEHCNRGIRILKDNDDTGIEGGRRLGEKIKEEYPSHKVVLGKYRDGLKKGYDLIDARIDSPTMDNFFDAIDRGEELKKPKKKGLYALGVKSFMKEEYVKTEPIIKNFLYSNHISIIGGDTGTMKSWLGMQSACSVASGIDFLGYFKTTPQKCMLIQFENENSDMQDRFKDMIAYFDKMYGSDEWQENLLIVPKDDEGQLFVDMWKEVEKVMKENDWYDAVVIIDNLYSSTEVDISTPEVKDVLREIDSIKRHFRASMLLIAHTNKIDHKVKDLKIDQIQGNKTLVSQVSNVIMLGKSSLSNDFKIMKFVKCRSDENRDLEETPFKIHWDEENAIFKKGAIIKDIALHFQPNKNRWELELINGVYNSMKVRTWFTRELFREHLPEKYRDMSKTKEGRLLTRLDKWGYIVWDDYDHYTFVINEIEGIE